MAEKSLKRSAGSESEPVSLSDRAIENLEFIRSTMERSGNFTAVPGLGGVLMGLTAFAAAFIANRAADREQALIVWLAEAALAFSIGLLAIWHKSQIIGSELNTLAARKFAAGFLPPVLCGVALTAGLWKQGLYQLMAPAWILLYGSAVIGGGLFSVKVVPLMGWCFLFIGAISVFLPAELSDEMMALSFGLLHIVFGIIIAKKYGG